MTAAGFDPWRGVERLPDHAPVRRRRPDALPRPLEVRRRLAAEGLDAASAGAIFGAILRRGWSAWLIAVPGPPPRFTGVVLEPRYGAAWAVGEGTTPAEALGAALVLCLDDPPWPPDDAPPGLDDDS